VLTPGEGRIVVQLPARADPDPLFSAHVADLLRSAAVGKLNPVWFTILSGELSTETLSRPSGR